MPLGVFAVWVGSILNIKVVQTSKQKCTRFGLVQLVFKKSSKLNQISAVKVGSICAFYYDIKNMTILPTYKINIGNFNLFLIPTV
jgi:hypothetical protein